MFEYKKIKLVIWDLDDTFWKGTLSEGPVEAIAENVQLVKDLTDRGIINTICSKNDYDPSIAELKKQGVDELFVFNSINWQPKGQRIGNLIKSMSLRPANVLFLDDNPVNLNEAKYYLNDLMTGGIDDLKILIETVKGTEPTDLPHKRLNQYKILETKQNDKDHFLSNDEFLYQSDTRVEILHDSMNVIDRIHELLLRSNQLNFTKIRSTKEELISTINDDAVESGYVKVSDRYGEYGIVGFYAMKEKKLIHFLFSCRTIGQGVEQYVYAKLGYPELQVNGDVISNVDHSEAPKWINNEEASRKKENVSATKTQSAKILFKGPCDILQTISYLESNNAIDTELSYVGEKRNNIIEQACSFEHIVQLLALTDEDKKQILDECIFADEKMFESKIFTETYDVIFLSTLGEPNLGIYRNKDKNFRVVFGEGYYPITDKNNWEKLINDEIFTAKNNFTEQYLQNFSSKYEFEGSATVERTEKNLKHILDNIKGNAKLCLILGSETPYLKNNDPAYNDREKKYQAINRMVKHLQASYPNLLTLDINKFLHGQSDFHGNINHYNRIVYFKMAEEAARIISECTPVNIKRHSWMFYALETFPKGIAMIKRKVKKIISK